MVDNGPPPPDLGRVGEAANPAPLVSILIVTFNSARHIAACMESVRAQDYAPLEIKIVDNASTDRTPEILRSVKNAEVSFNTENRGFAAAQNQAMRSAKGEWLLCLNPDVVLSTDFVRELVSALSLDAKVGTVCGKLLRWQPGKEPERTKVIDSTGIYFLPNLRHLDRGSEQIDSGQYDRMEYVFGATGAAALYRRAMVEDVSVNGEFFDEEFFSYREDADLAWRAQLMGWKCLYTPTAVAWHERRVTPERRERLPHEINWHSVKNRFLMRAKNIGSGLWWRTFLPAGIRDQMILSYALLRNWKLFSAVNYWAFHQQSWFPKRTAIQRKRRISDRELARWFKWKPASEPFEKSAGAAR